MGCLTGALGIALLIWLFGGLVNWTTDMSRSLLILVFATGVVVGDLGLWRIPLPESRRQVPRTVFRQDLLLAAFQFGLEMGTAARTYNSSHLPYLCGLVILFLATDPVLPLYIAVGFGLGRGTLPWLRLLSHDGLSWDAQLARESRWIAPAVTISAMPLVMRLTLG